MIGTRRSPEAKATRADDNVVGIFLTPNGRLPDFAQRRLDALIDKKRSQGLTRQEKRELSEALDYIDAKTAEMLEHALSVQSLNPAAATGRTGVRGADESARHVGGGRPSGPSVRIGTMLSRSKSRRGGGSR
jgi:hypothetical protein